MINPHIHCSPLVEQGYHVHFVVDLHSGSVIATDCTFKSFVIEAGIDDAFGVQQFSVPA
jgi:alpha-acetolactate decarboxylase